MLAEMKEAWEDIFFNLMNHKTSDIIRGYDEI